MTHPRAVIRQLSKERLEEVTGLPVFKSRKRPLSENLLPAFVVSTPNENIDENSYETAPREKTRTISLIIDCIAQGCGEESLNDFLDSMALMVEQAIEKDETFSGEADDTILLSTETQFEADAKTVTGVSQLTFSVQVTSEAAEITDGLEDFQTAEAKFNLSNVQQEDDLAKDLITLQQE